MVETDLNMQIPDEVSESGEKSICESIKLIKNSRGYNWEIRLFPNLSLDISEMEKEWLDRLDRINSTMMRKFGDLKA